MSKRVVRGVINLSAGIVILTAGLAAGTIAGGVKLQEWAKNDLGSNGVVMLNLRDQGFKAGALSSLATLIVVAGVSAGRAALMRIVDGVSDPKPETAKLEAAIAQSGLSVEQWSEVIKESV
jgi:hypothetical protein